MASWQAAENRPYSNAYFINTFAEMVGLSFDELDHSASLISDHYRPMPRWIGDPNDPGSLRDYSSIEDSENQLQVVKRHEEEPIKAL